MVYWYDYDYKVVPSRDFSPGEIFWVNRIGWRSLSFGGDSAKPARPGIVLKPSVNPEPVIMAPGTTKKHSANGFFRPVKTNYSDSRQASPESSFVIKFRRPVDRKYIEGMFGKISAQDIEVLSEMANKKKRRKK